MLNVVLCIRFACVAQLVAQLIRNQWVKEPEYTVKSIRKYNCGRKSTLISTTIRNKY